LKNPIPEVPETPASTNRVTILLSAAWFFYLGGLGSFLPFFSLYLRQGAGLTGSEIGLVVASMPAVALATQTFWGYLADRSGSRTLVLALLGAGTSAGYFTLSLPTAFPGLLLATTTVAIFSTALVPNCVSVSFALLRDPNGRLFGKVRVLGTIGFGVVVAGFPWLARHFAGAGEGADLGLIFVVGASMMGMGTLCTLALPRKAGALALRARPGDARTLIHYPGFLRLLVLVFLTYLCIQGPMVFFPILVNARGGGIEAISTMWLFMLSLEVPLVYFFGSTLQRFGATTVIAIGVLAAGVRWTVSGFASDLDVVTAAQVLHGVTVWGLVLGAPMYVDRVVPEKLRSTAQGVLATGISLASIASHLIAGWLTESVGATAPAQWGGVSALALAALLPLLLARPRESRPREASS